MRSIFELSTSEVWHLLAEQLGEEVPPLDAVENEIGDAIIFCNDSWHNRQTDWRR
jgi:hypothetical protein